MIYDDLDRHLPAAGSIEHAAVPMGMYLAWSVNLNLIGDELTEFAQQRILRVRYREITGSELLVADCGGALDSRWFNPTGVEFCDRYYPRYMDDYRRVFGDAIYAVSDDWDHYDQLAGLLTQRLYGEKSKAQTGWREAGQKSPWWQFWR